MRSSATAEDLRGRELRRAAGHLPQRPRRGRGARRPCANAGRRSGPNGRWPTAPARASTRRTSRWPSSSSGWSRPTRPGVMFTANPTNGRRDEVVLSAAWGLGESVVGGSVTTDDRRRREGGPAGGRPLHRRQGGHDRLRGRAHARRSPVPPQRRGAPVLDDKAAAELAELGMRIEQHYGAPQDVEWARAGGEFFVVQARPITALPEPEAAPPTEWAGAGPEGVLLPRRASSSSSPTRCRRCSRRMVDGSVDAVAAGADARLPRRRQVAACRRRAAARSTATPTTATRRAALWQDDGSARREGR